MGVPLDIKLNYFNWENYLLKPFLWEKTCVCITVFHLFFFYLIVPLRSSSCNIFWWDSSLTRDTSCPLPAASWLRCTNTVKSTINDSRWFLESHPLQHKGWHRWVRSLFTMHTAYVHVDVVHAENISSHCGQTGLYPCKRRPTCTHIPGCVSSTIITSISFNLTHTYKAQFCSKTCKPKSDVLLSKSTLEAHSPFLHFVPILLSFAGLFQNLETNLAFLVSYPPC